MRIFITGVEGVLGSVLAKELRTRGHEVFGCGLQHSADPNVVRANIANARQFMAGMIKTVGYSCDLIYHLAGEFGRNNGRDFYEELWTSNCIGTNNVIAAARIYDCPMVFASSSEAYGLSELYNDGQSLREEMLDHNVPQYHNEYALSKFCNERQVFTAVRNEGLKAIVLRFFNVYGPPERFSPYRSVVCQFAWKLLNGLPLTVNREGKRSHLWIGDWANTVANIAEGKRLESLLNPHKLWPGAGGTPGVPVFNIGSSDYESIESLYNKLVDIIGSKTSDETFGQSDVTFIESEPANSATKRPNCVQAEVYLDHNPVMPLEDGLCDTVDFLNAIKRGL